MKSVSLYEEKRKKLLRKHQLRTAVNASICILKLMLNVFASIMVCKELWVVANAPLYIGVSVMLVGFCSVFIVSSWSVYSKKVHAEIELYKNQLNGLRYQQKRNCKMSRCN